MEQRIVVLRFLTNLKARFKKMSF